MVYIKKCFKCYIAEFTRSVEPLKCISIYSYVLSIEKQTAVQSAAIQTAVPNQFEHEKLLCRTEIAR